MLNVNLENINFVGDVLDQTLIYKNHNYYVSLFIEAIIDNKLEFKGKDTIIKISYLNALYAVKSMLRAAVL